MNLRKLVNYTLWANAEYISSGSDVFLNQVEFSCVHLRGVLLSL